MILIVLLLLVLCPAASQAQPSASERMAARLRSPRPSPHQPQYPEHERRQRRLPARAASQGAKSPPQTGPTPRIGHPASARRLDARGHCRTALTASARPAPWPPHAGPRPPRHRLLTPRRARKLPAPPHHRLLSATHPRRGYPHPARRLTGRHRTVRSGPARKPGRLERPLVAQQSTTTATKTSTSS